MTLLATSTGTTHEATVRSSGQSTYKPYAFPEKRHLVFEVEAREVEPMSDLLVEIQGRITRLGGSVAARIVGYQELAQDAEYREVRRAVRIGGAARAARNAQD